VSEDVVAVYRHRTSEVHQAVGEIKPPSQKDHPVTNFGMRDLVDDGFVSDIPLHQSRAKGSGEMVGIDSVKIIKMITDQFISVILI